MFKRVLVGIDTESHGCDAIALARRLAPEADITLAHVCTGFPVVGEESDNEREVSQASAVLEAARLESGVVADLSVIGAYRVGAGLHQLAHELETDLVVIGSTRTARLGRVLITRELAQSLGGLPAALAVAPFGYAGDEVPFGEIGVAYDRSPESAAALVFAADLARASGAHLVAFTAAPLPHGDMRHGVWDTFASAIRDRVASTCTQVRGDLEALGLDGGVEGPVTVVQSTCGEPVEELAQFSSAVDLIVVASRGYGPSGCLVYGATGGQLTRYARAPLLMLPRATALTPGVAFQEAGTRRGRSGTGEFSSSSIVSTAAGRAR